jgi:surfactin synthase thioesterase subunit
MYAKKKSDVLNIDDFARALLAALSSSKYFANVETPIVFIGHSMGGLVIKKVCQVSWDSCLIGSLRRLSLGVE